MYFIYSMNGCKQSMILTHLHTFKIIPHSSPTLYVTRVHQVNEILSVLHLISYYCFTCVITFTVICFMSELLSKESFIVCFIFIFS